jgi:hypothetical protein
MYGFVICRNGIGVLAYHVNGSQRGHELPQTSGSFVTKNLMRPARIIADCGLVRWKKKKRNGQAQENLDHLSLILSMTASSTWRLRQVPHSHMDLCEEPKLVLPQKLN